LEEFGKRYSILAGVQLRIQLKIRQVTGLRDGISAVTNVDDSRTTIKQGNNIRVLTLITIAYLPLGFATSLFSANHDILPTDAGTTLYAILTVIFVVTTYGLALSLEVISDFINSRWARFRDRKQTRLSALGASKTQEIPAKDSNTEEVKSVSMQEQIEVVTQKRPGLFSVSSGSQAPPRDIEAGQGEGTNTVISGNLETK
jgi:CorA-like Mg2+ transporter protein